MRIAFRHLSLVSSLRAGTIGRAADHAEPPPL
jgi:hypothetical protein